MVLITTLDLSEWPLSGCFMSHPLRGKEETIAVPPEVGRNWDDIERRERFRVWVRICVESAFVSATRAINGGQNWQTRQLYQS